MKAPLTTSRFLARHGSLPAPRGPLSAVVVDALRTGCAPDAPAIDPTHLDVVPLDDGDLHLALYLLYELHYGLDGVDDRLEWHPGLLELRARLESRFERGLRAAVPPWLEGDLRDSIRAAIAREDGPSLSAAVARTGTLTQLREFAMHRSAYQLKEADPHTWAIPRLRGDAKAALVQIQGDEYGWGQRRAMHAELFARTMRCLGLDDRPNAYLDALPGTTLATVNLVSMFGLHRRLRGALVGHLTVFEMTSVVPMGRYASALERLGVDPAAREFYDAHVAADAVHQVVALDELAAGFVRDEPAQAPEVVFGAHAVLLLERRFATHLLDSWAKGRSSLLGAHASAA